MPPEEVVGRLIGDRRQHWVLATKFVNPNPGGSGPNNSGASRQNVIASVDASLKRLNTDYIDLPVLPAPRRPRHPGGRGNPACAGRRDPCGQIRWLGCPAHRGWKLAEFNRSADILGIQRPSVSQPLYNLANRQIEVEHLPAAGITSWRDLLQPAGARRAHWQI